MIHGLIGDQRLFPDNEMFWPIFARAQELGVPIYLHPANIHPAVAKAYLNDYASEYPGLMNAGWGFTMETATIGIRMVLSRVLSDIPTYRLYLATSANSTVSHGRIDLALNRPGNDGVAFRDVFTSSISPQVGFFSDPAMLCCIQEMGADRILFAIDYPFVPIMNLDPCGWSG